MAYARPELLAETSWLVEHLNDPGLRIVDADNPLSYARAHIPGAVAHLTENVYLKTKHGETFLMDGDQFAATMSAMGIGNETEVVVYDSQRSLLAARFWWALHRYGHRRCRVLNGGWHKWLVEGRPITMSPTKPPTASFASRQDDSQHATCDLVLAAVGHDDSVVLDVRNETEWNGTNTRGNQRAGHVPGAVHLEWTELMTADDRKVFKPAEEMRAMFESRGVTPDKNVFVY